MGSVTVHDGGSPSRRLGSFALVDFVGRSYTVFGTKHLNIVSLAFLSTLGWFSSLEFFALGTKTRT